MVLITILNDGTIISIAYDHVVPGDRPEKWHLPIVFSVAVLLGGVACISSLAMLLLCLYSRRQETIFTEWFDAGALSYKEIMCVMYLKVSISDFLTVFAARTHGPFFSRR